MSKKIWLASFPRSGNTFFRNILFHVYSIKSREDHEVEDTSLGDKFVVTKTHALPFLLNNYKKGDTVIYLVRDGRDSICSLANQRKNLIEPNSILSENYIQATKAENGAFFGGWDMNCKFWLKENPIIIRFEDLVKNPQEVFTELQKSITLPEANWENLPTFEKQRNAETKFGNYLDQDPSKKQSKLFFNKGKVGTWKEELSRDLQEIFWLKSKETMHALGYHKDGKITDINIEKLEILKSKTYLKNKLFFKYIDIKKRLKLFLGV